MKDTKSKSVDTGEAIKTKKKLSKRATLAIIASVCAVVAVIAIVTPIAIIFGNKNTVPQPFFFEFNDETDYYVRVKWNKVHDAGSYTYVYYYGNAEEADKSNDLKPCVTQNTTAVFPRKKGKVSFRVKANIAGEKTLYSDWITIDISAWKLSTPIITFNENWNIFWTAINFNADDKSYLVGGYEGKILVDGDEVSLTNFYFSTNSADIGQFVKEYLKNTDKIQGYYLGEEWQDINLCIKIKAVSYVKFGSVNLNPETPNDVLVTVYDDSDYGILEIVVTEEIYKGMK